MLAIFGIGMTELIILGVIGGLICLPITVAIVVIASIATKNDRPRE